MIPRAIAADEWLDDPAVGSTELGKSFDDIERANRWFGGVAPIVREVFARDCEWVLDVGCGSADIPRALLREARRRGRKLEVVGLDRSEGAIAVARERARGETALRFACAEASSLPFPDASFDVVTCSLTLHHLAPDDAIVALREMRRVARLCPLVCDLRRSLHGYLGALFFGKLIARSRLSRHDAPLSARRAYTPREMKELARQAAWTQPRVRLLPFSRMLLTDA